MQTPSALYHRLQPLAFAALFIAALWGQVFGSIVIRRRAGLQYHRSLSANPLLSLWRASLGEVLVLADQINVDGEVVAASLDVQTDTHRVFRWRQADDRFEVIDEVRLVSYNIAQQETSPFSD